MSNIEFLDDGPNKTELPTSDAPADPFVRTRLAVAALLIGSAGLFVGAPFANVYPVDYTNTDGSSSDLDHTSVDGWGRLSSDTLRGQHAVRLGTGLCVVAAVLVLVAVLGMTPRVVGPGPARLRKWTRGMLLLTVGVATGLLGAAALDLQAQLDSVAGLSSSDQQIHVTPGGFFWLGSTALVLAVLAAVVPHVPRRRGPAGRAGDPQPTAPQADLAHG